MPQENAPPAGTAAESPTRQRYRTRPALRRGLTAVAGLLTVAAAAASASPAVAATDSPGPAATATSTPYLPAPTGPHPVGTTSLHLTDNARQDPWVPAAGARELLVSLWYPATSPGTRRARYVTPKESELLLHSAGITEVPSDALSRTRTNAFTDVAPAGSRHSLPLVVLSPGFTWPRSSLSALAEELASRGYVVAGIDHTYETHATTFPDGRVTTCAACQLMNTPDFEQAVVENRARDVSFVLDELTAPQSAWRDAALIDPSRIAMVGMSLGGASVSETMVTDPRVLAGADLDGTMYKPLPERGLSRPFLIFGRPVADETVDRNWPLLTGWKRQLAVTGAVHISFTDYDMLTQQIGVDFGSDLAGTRSVEITRGYVRAFVDLHLRGRPQPLLEQPSTRYPEVRFCTPETNPCQ